MSALLILILGPVLLAGEARPEIPAAPVMPGASLLPGDVLAIDVYEHPDLQLTTRIDSDGTIRFPLCGAVAAAGRTTGQLADHLAVGLREANVERPEVFVFVEEYAPRTVYVLGAVKKPQSLSLPLEAGLTALQAISSAGGLSERADARGVHVRRTPDSGKPVQISVNAVQLLQQTPGSKDVALRPGDMVIVPTARPVSVLGRVRQPGTFLVDTVNPASLLEMLSRAGGFEDDASRSAVSILRRRPGEGLERILVNVGTDAQSRPEALQAVQPGDTILVPPGEQLFVLGRVKSAGAFSLRPGVLVTVSRAIAMAGGFDSLAAEEATLLVRNGHITQVNLRKAIRRDGNITLDVPVLPGDIVFVPESRW